MLSLPAFIAVGTLNKRLYDALNPFPTLFETAHTEWAFSCYNLYSKQSPFLLLDLLSHVLPVYSSSFILLIADFFIYSWIT